MYVCMCVCQHILMRKSLSRSNITSRWSFYCRWNELYITSGNDWKNVCLNSGTCILVGIIHRIYLLTHFSLLRIS